MAKLTKTQAPPEDRLDGKLTGDLEDIEPKKQLKIIKHDYDLAMNSQLMYNKLMEEISGYIVELPKNPDVIDLSDINTKYHFAQSYATRVSNIEVQAIANENMWTKLKHMLEEYLAERECIEFTSEYVTSLSNSGLQKAEVRKRLVKIHKVFSRVKIAESEAKAFAEMVKVKKKDLFDTIQNLNRQIKVLSLESSLNR